MRQPNLGAHDWIYASDEDEVKAKKDGDKKQKKADKKKGVK